MINDHLADDLAALDVLRLLEIGDDVTQEAEAHGLLALLDAEALRQRLGIGLGMFAHFAGDLLPRYIADARARIAARVESDPRDTL